MSAPQVRPTFLQLLYNHNPFYAISAVLVLYSVQSAHATVPIGDINVSLLTGVLAGYTLVLAIMGVLIVRYGQVWEDARSVFVLLLILFLAVSVGADELFVTDVTSSRAIGLLAAGYLFSAGLSEAVLRLSRIQLGMLYRVPYHLLLALFYLAPWWCSPELHRRSYGELEWTLFLFPVIASAWLLLLLPAVRRGAAYTLHNGTPWPWPWFPWTLFGVLIAAIGLRSFVLAMAFGPHGPMWIELSDGSRLISFDTIWGPHFLIAPAMAVLLIVFECALQSHNRRLAWRCVNFAPALVLLALPYSRGPVFGQFWEVLTVQVGSPLWITVCLLIGFYAVAWLRGVRSARFGLAGMVLMLSMIGRQTPSLAAMHAPEPWPLLLVGCVSFALGLRRGSSLAAAGGMLLAVLGLWLLLPSTPLAAYRATTCYHLAAIGIVWLGLGLKDQWAEYLRMAGAVQFPLASVAALVAPQAAIVPLWGRLLYVGGLTMVCFILARRFRSRWYFYAFTGQLAAGGYAAMTVGFRQAVSVVGRGAMTSFLWSIGTLGIAGLISAHKAKWLPPWLSLPWGARGGPPLSTTAQALAAEADDSAPVSDGTG